MQTLKIRRSHSYVGTWKHLDKHDTVGAYETLSSKSWISDPEDYCEPMTHKHIVRVKREPGVPLRDIKNALYDEFSAWGCDHEYDCCGCRSYSTNSVRKLMNGTYLVVVHSSRNF